MTVEWLEEQLANALAENDRLRCEAEELKGVIYDLLPIDHRTEKCELCAIGDIPSEKKWHLFTYKCLQHEFYDKARKVLGL